MSHKMLQILKKLTVMIWEAALPPCICAVLTVLTYLTLVDKNYWDLTFQAILGKLYVISLFVTLNGRADLQDGPVPGFSTNRISNFGPPWSLNTPIRVDIPTDMERGVSTGHTQGDDSVDTPTDPARSAACAGKTS
ncbi:hypothetical protein TRAPUB_7528 [Trametes pubescens]|uniref:DUF6534 domain-containing protein n=1 Tax=Trametes pubescens TaxID=154538 RepID=A0A1M2V331_TRAPU|nr:hypothetical protein TRAPUB_7528 [Trametes pubescens]